MSEGQDIYWATKYVGDCPEAIYSIFDLNSIGLLCKKTHFGLQFFLQLCVVSSSVNSYFQLKGPYLNSFN